MEFYEKLQELRKSRGLTQEELAEALYVSRTAVSKWESGRGYPSIDSLKEIAGFFSVSIDDLLSGEQLVTLAEKEKTVQLQGLRDLLTGILDLLSFLLVILPLYPKTVDGYIFSVNLISYTQTAAFYKTLYWILFLALMMTGIMKTMVTLLKRTKGQKFLTVCSMGGSVITILFLAMTREAYAVTLTFLLFLIKGILLVRK